MPACCWMRSSPTDAAAARPSLMSLRSMMANPVDVVRSDAEWAQTPAKQSAWSS